MKCERLLGWSADERAVFERAAATLVADTSWDRTAAAMQELLRPLSAAGGTLARLPVAEATPAA